MIKKISMITTIAFVIFIMVFNSMLKREEEKKTEKIIEANAQAEIYEKEIERLKTALQTGDFEIKVNVEQTVRQPAGVCLAAKVDTFQELVWISEWMKPYDLPLNLILGSDMTTADQTKILDLLGKHPEWGFMLEGDKEQWIERTANIYKALETAKLQDIGFIYLTESPTAEQLQTIKTAGWKGYSNYLSYSGDANTAMSSTGLSRIGHVLLSEEKIVKTVAKDAVQNESMFILSVEMDKFNQEFTKDTFDRVLTILEEDYIEPQKLAKISLKEYFKEAETNKTPVVDTQAEYEKYEKQYQQQIEELEAKIIQLYEDLN